MHVNLNQVYNSLAKDFIRAQLLFTDHESVKLVVGALFYEDKPWSELVDSKILALDICSDAVFISHSLRNLLKDLCADSFLVQLWRRE